MSTITRTGFEKAALGTAHSMGIMISRSQQKRVGRECVRRISRMTDLEKERLVMHSDPVPCEALHHLLGTTPCQRCGQAPRALTA
ncbi:hypothetical protein [Nesterenkonia sandarakina]|uniref:Uncharacterized protein n=1 Tax=Nesterenkonia sandarakina TaxID=272918 RepID=A0A2T0YJ02_9MICC|nr:hypothetical protein [Nesterenkonia sandarakina]PRZ15182.1 hypothetical protein BCL67_109103 [Nesterenkonia sandarakina]